LGWLTIRIIGAVVFLYDDKRVLGDTSPKMREWEIGREYRLEAMVHQVRIGAKLARNERRQPPDTLG
jgi:hypothetical protein